MGYGLCEGIKGLRQVETRRFEIDKDEIETIKD